MLHAEQPHVDHGEQRTRPCIRHGRRDRDYARWHERNIGQRQLHIRGAAHGDRGLSPRRPGWCRDQYGDAHRRGL